MTLLASLSSAYFAEILTKVELKGSLSMASACGSATNLTDSMRSLNV